MLTEQEKEQVRYHLGYMETSFGGNQAAASLQFGIPRPAETMFLLEEAIQNLLTNQFAIERVRKVLRIMNDMESKIEAASCTLAAEQIGNLKLRSAKCGETHPDLLEREYLRWGYRLADILGVPVYPFSRRYQRGSGCAKVGNVPVRW